MFIRTRSVFFMLLIVGAHLVLAANDSGSAAAANEEENGYCQGGDEQNDSFCAARAVDKSTVTDEVIYDGDQGKWQEMIGPDDPGYYACGVKLRIQSYDDDNNVDNKGVDGMKMKFCNHEGKWTDYEPKIIEDGAKLKQGDWQKDWVNCPRRSWISGGRVKYDSNENNDKLGMTGLVIHCKNPDAEITKKMVGCAAPIDKSVDLNKNPNDKDPCPDAPGEWKDEVDLKGKLVRKANVRFQDYQGSGDDTGINGWKVETEEPAKAEWVQIPIEPTDTASDGMSIPTKMVWFSSGVVEEARASVHSSFVWINEHGEESFYAPGDFVSYRVSSLMHKSFSFKEEKLFEVHCAPGQALWQWQMRRDTDDYGPGFECWSHHYVCGNNPPQCPLGFCEDRECQVCRPDVPQPWDPPFGTPEPLYHIDFTVPKSKALIGYELNGDARIESPAPDGVPRALRIDSFGSYANVPGVDISPSKMSDCTVVLGIYLEEIKAGSRGWILSHDNGHFDRGVILHDNRSGGLGLSAGQIFSVHPETTYPETKKWIHIVAIFRHGGDSHLFVDGVKAPITVGTGFAGEGHPDLHIGQPRDYPVHHDSNVWVRDVEVYDRALSGQEVKALFYTYKEETRPNIRCGNNVTAHICSACPSEKGAAIGCAGDCAWDSSLLECIHIGKFTGVNCGDHEAASNCGNCDTTSRGAEGCKGDCAWKNSKCTVNDCGTGNLQHDYRGKTAVTRSGRTCQQWDTNEPHTLSFTPLTHPNAGLDENYCRNPSNNAGGAWCYTTDPDRRWEYCDVPTCTINECGTGNLQHDYRGMTSTTRSGTTCQRWDTNEPHSLSFTPQTHPFAGLDENYCRNPSNSAGGAWCYTTDSNKRWDYCAIPTCATHECANDDDCQEKETLGNWMMCDSGKCVRKEAEEDPKEAGCKTLSGRGGTNYYGPPCEKAPLKGTCGGGERGNGCCPAGTGCSEYGYCGWQDESYNTEHPLKDECHKMMVDYLYVA